MENGQLWRQYLIAAIANIAVLATGVNMGWTAPINVKLADNSTTSTSPLNIIPTKDQLSWMGSLLTVGAIFGPFMGGPAASKLGRKWGLMTSSIPLLIGWILVLVANNMYYLYAGRIAWGVAVGMIFTISPMYCAEIATDECRGALGSYLQAFITVGFLLVYAVGPFVTYNEVGYFGIVIVAVFCVTFFFMPETPTYHLLKNDRSRAAECLSTLRGRSIAGVEGELNQLEVNIKASMEKTATLKDIFKGGNFKAFYISCALIFFQQLSGVNAVLFYLTDIFDDSGTSVDPAIAAIIIGAMQAMASLMTPFVVDRLGRRLLLLVSSCGTAIGLVLLGTFFLLKASGSPVVGSIGFLPILSLVLFIVTYCWGLGPLPWAVLGELFPVEVKVAAAPIVTALSWFLSFLVTRYFEPIALAIGRYVAFWVFAIFCVMSFFFTLFVLPETKGKSFQEIQDMLAGRKSPKLEKS